MIINIRLIYSCITISGLLLALLILFPNLDIYVSEVFYRENKGFIYQDNELVQLLFLSIPTLTKALFFVSLCALLHNLTKYKKLKFLILSWGFYIIITIAVGPGLVVNYLFKENLGRARPSQIENFGGDKEFSKAFSLSNQCMNNCSFSSGHAAIGYYFTALAYIFPAVYFSRIYLTALLFGSSVGLGRILMGGHFLSDVVASCFIILIINHIIYTWWKKYPKIDLI